MYYHDHINTPIGVLQVSASAEAIRSIDFVDNPTKVNANAVTDNATLQLQEYFAGSRQEFDLPLNAIGTDFQMAVWQALTEIRYGDTGSYSDIANLINNPKAVRAVGAANGKNPMTIVVPCHRIIGRDGSLTGYASGTDRKSWLLNHERSVRFGDTLF